METINKSWRSAWLRDGNGFEKEQEKSLEVLLSSNPDLEYFLEQMPSQTTNNIFDMAGSWNKSQQKPAEGMYTIFRFNFKGTDKKLAEFSVKSFKNGRVTISVSR